MLVLVACIVGGVIYGSFFVESMAPGQRFCNAVFYGSLYAYLAVVSLDLIEHFKLEKFVSGSYFMPVVIPWMETVLHGLIGLTIALVISLARPIHTPLASRDWLLIILPVAFLFLGWADEVFFHRKRALHREDILHTTSHLVAGVMLVSLFLAKAINWE